MNAKQESRTMNFTIKGQGKIKLEARNDNKNK